MRLMYAAASLSLFAPVIILARTGEVLAQATTILQEQGRLDSSDERLTDNSPFDIYNFNGSAGQEITITLESTDFDTYLLLVDPSGNTISQNDDADSGTTNSRVVFTLPSAGQYSVVANTYAPSAQGRYTLTVTAQSSTSLAQSSSASEGSAFVSIPNNSSKSCADAINDVKAELTEKGFFIPWEEEMGVGLVEVTPEVNTYTDQIAKAYYDYPTSRTHTVSFSLSGDFNKVDTLLASPQLMSILSAQIMADCEQVGLVEFNHWWEGGVPVGYFPDNTARPFQPVTWGRAPGFLSEEDIDIRTIETENGPTRIYPWGYYLFI